MENLQIAFGDDADSQHGTSQTAVGVNVVRTPTSRRQVMALCRLRIGPVSRAELDSELGASNSPDVIYQLRRRGFVIATEMVTGVNRWNERVEYARYSLTAAVATGATAPSTAPADPCASFDNARPAS